MTRVAVAALVFCGCWQPPSFGGEGGGTQTATAGGAGGGGGGVFSNGGGFIGAGGGDFGPGGANGCSTGFDFDLPELKAMPPAISGGTMASLPNGTVVAGDPDRDVLWVVEPVASLVRRVDLTYGDQPGRVIAGPDGVAFVVLRRAHQVAQLTVATGEVQRLETCHLPRALVWQAGSNTLVVACADGTIEQLHEGTRTPLKLSAPLNDLRDLVPDGTGFVATTFREAKAFRVTAQGEVTELPAVGLSPDGQAQVAWRAIAGPTSTTVVLQSERTTPIVLSRTTCGAYGQGGAGGPGGFDAGVPGGLGSVVVTTLAHTSAAGLQIDQLMPLAVLPVDVAVNAQGLTAVLSAGTNQVVFSSGLVMQLSGQPTSVVWQPSGWAVFEREPAAIAYFSPAGLLLRELPLPGASVASTGHQLFHTATSANLACASCHPEGGEDGHVWNFDTGPRRTQTLRGGLSSTMPFHWEGDEPNMVTLVSDVMSGRMGGHAQSPERTQALLQWLDTQPALEAPPTDAAAVARGAAIFASSTFGCASCHTGTLGTNNQTLDVGTGGAFQVPRLVELGWRANWFHDGRVKTPSERFSPQAGGDLHGTVSALTTEQKADLLEYLRSR